jgi:hypothetical protein
MFFRNAFFSFSIFNILKNPPEVSKIIQKKNQKKQNRFLALSGQHAGQPTPGQQGVVLCVFFKLI